MIDDRTTNLDLPLPNPHNNLEVDVYRLRDAMTVLDVAIPDAATKADWPSVAAKPATFPPSTHRHGYTDLDGAPEIAPASTTTAGVIRIATPAEVATGTSSDCAVTPAHLLAALPEQDGHAGEMLTTDGAAASWSAVPKTDWGSITGKPEMSVEAVPDAVPLRDAEGRLVGNITGTAVYA